MENKNSSLSVDSVELKRGRIRNLKVYDVTEDELKSLERGGDVATKLTFAISLFSSALTALVALLTTEIKSNYTRTFFISLTLVGFIWGFSFLLSWHKNRKSVSNTASEIRKRLNGNGSGNNPN